MVSNQDLEKWKKAIQGIEAWKKDLPPDELSAFQALVAFYNNGDFESNESGGSIKVIKDALPQHSKHRLLKVCLTNFVALCEQYFTSKNTAPILQRPITVSAPQPATPQLQRPEIPASPPSSFGDKKINSISNSKQWSSKTPGYIIFLVDQSGSMSETYPEKRNKAAFTAMVINRTISELININVEN
jgi:hypothetical protein